MIMVANGKKHVTLPDEKVKSPGSLPRNGTRPTSSMI